MKNLKFRRLRAGEIDVRVESISEKGCSLLLYKDARVDQNILDETVGALNWTRSHQLIGENLYCTVSIRDGETGYWVSKQDVGTESYTGKAKGQASDSFKRACFNWGIGRELYTAPFIWINAGQVNLKKNQAGKMSTYDRFTVKEIGYSEDGKINRLVIANMSLRGGVVYEMGQEPVEDPLADEKTKAVIKAICEKHGFTPEKLCAANGIAWENLTEAQAGMMKASLARKYGE